MTDRRAYDAGWAAYHRGADGALDRADARRVPDAWYVGYLDAADQRPKYAGLDLDV